MIDVDPNNPVVQLCAQGMQAEVEGRDDDAGELFRRAWQAAADDYDACVAAHYVARHQRTAEQILHWNQECLERADRVGDERVLGFYPSLHLNLAQARRDLGDLELAYEHFAAAAEYVRQMPAGPYADWIRFAIAEGRRATSAGADDPVRDLLSNLCARADLKVLALILPAYVGDLGTQEDRLRLISALSMVHASRSLEDADQGAVGQAIRLLSAST